MAGIVAALGVHRLTAAASVSIGDQSISESSFHTATASYSIANNGNVTSSSGTLEAWLIGTGGAVANYEVMATVISGTLTSGTTDTWLNCATTRTWAKSNSAGNNSTVTVVLSVSIRAGSTVLDTAFITLNAESERIDGGGGFL